MDNRSNKPKETTAQLIDKLEKYKGITFNYVSKEEAKEYLLYKNHYIRLKAYCKNYKKDRNGKYINLDFAYLQELSTLDTQLRMLLLKMSLDVEHSMKVNLLRDLEFDEDMNGYDIVDEYFAENPYIVRQLQIRCNSDFSRGLMQKYFTITEKKDKNTGKVSYKITGSDCPAWVLVELLSFGEFIRFYEFFYRRNEEDYMSDSVTGLVNNLRNVCAHNNCLIADLNPGKSYPPAELVSALLRLEKYNEQELNVLLSCQAVQEYSAIIYLFDMLVPKSSKVPRVKELNRFFKIRAKQNDYFNGNELIKKAYNYAVDVLDYFLSDEQYE